MIDREKVIDGLNETISYLRLKTGGVVDRCIQHQYDALELLKGQEALEPVRMHHTEHKQTDNYRCKFCGDDMYFEQRYCECCGKKVKWE